MKTKQEIEQLAEERFPINQDSRNSLLVDSGRQRGFEEGYSQCQEDMADEMLDELEKFTLEYEKDMADKKLDIDDINEMALDYIINNGGLPDSVEALQYCLHKFYQLTKQTRQ